MTEQVWLAASAYQRLRSELSGLLRQRDLGSTGDSAGQFVGDSADQGTDQQFLTAQRERHNRIRKLQELLQNPSVGQEPPPDDGVAEPGMMLTVRYADDEAETFLLTHHEDGAYPADLMTCSPDSPLGRALHGRMQGDKVQYGVPDGQTMEVTLLRAVPYRSEVPSTAASTGD